MLLRSTLAAILIAVPLSAANWTEYRIGPFRVISDAGDRPARERLTEMEQLRYALGNVLGKNDLQTVWPIQMVLFPNQRELGAHAIPAPFVDGGSSTLSAWTADTALPRDWRRALALRLIEDNAGRMPDTIETALGDLFSTLQVNATRVSLGAPPPQGELPPERMRTWARIQMLATQPDYSGKLRVYLNNLQQGGDEAVAARNAFGLSLAELNQRAEAYFKAGNFSAEAVNGEAIAPNRDFIEKQVPESAVNDLFAELKAAGKSFPEDSPRGLLAKNTRPALELAAKANPRWAEPHIRMAELETTPAGKAKELKAAAALEPRNSALWQKLAVAQAEAEQFADSEKSWTLAERNAPNDAERTRIHQARVDIAEQRAAFELAERKRLAEERAAELQRLKDSAAAEVHAAEAAANARAGGLKSAQAPVAWWNDADGKGVSGSLTRVDCLKGPLRLTIQPASGAPLRLLIRDPSKLAVKGANEAKFSCGVQQPARKINVVHNGKPDAAQGTAGDVSTVELP